MKSYKKSMYLWIAALLLCLLFVGCGQDKPNSDSGSDVLTDVTATDEAHLRQLLAQDGELVIRVTEDMQIREGFSVNGVKTLMGDAKLQMQLDAQLGQKILSVSADSSLTLDGPVLDCNYLADGIFVDAGAELISLSGTVMRPGAYGILTYGDVTVEDITISDSEFIAVCAQTGSRVYIKGGQVRGSASNDIYVVNGAYVNVSGDTVMEGALEHAMINYGTLELHGGKFGHVNNYLCDNYGQLTVAYEGEDPDGAVEFYGARLSVFLIRKGSEASFSKVYIHDTERQGIASLGGDTTISDCKFVNTGNHSIDIQSGEAKVERIVVTDSKGSGLEASNGAKVTVTDFTVNSCEKIGIASRGASVTATNISISNTGKYGLTCGTTQTGKGVLTVKDAVLTKTTNHGIYIYDNGTADMENVSVSGGESRGIYVAATANCKISGESSFQNMTKGGVEVRGNLELNDTQICNNHIQNSGAGVYVADGGQVIMNGGAVYNNRSALRGGGICVSDATLTISGTSIYGNTAANHGGGIYVQKQSLVSLKSGKVTGNYSAANGDGIYILSANSQVKIAENFYLGGNDIKVDSVDAMVKFTGQSMKYHNQADPVLLTPNSNAKEGTVIAICDSESIANNVAVASGDGSYKIVQDGRKFVINYAQADMDMTDADTVRVSTFAQLKKAVEGTTTKRNIIVESDIVFTERIRIPGGVTVQVQDDGTKRTMTRADGFTDSFFVTHYGTGLYLTGTAENMLVLDGAGAEGANKPLVRVAGSTELRNVTLCNNGSALKEHDVRGALVRQIYGDIKIYHCDFHGGQAYAGGAVMIDQGTAYVEDSTFAGNTSAIGGGAVRVAGGSQVQIKSCEMKENQAGSAGGAIAALDGAQVCITDSAFESNTAASYGGALIAQDSGTKITLVGTGDQAVFKNNTSVTAGAVYTVKGVVLEISGYCFDGNSATDGRAGAISLLDASVATITDTTFYNNTASGSGGALSVSDSQADLIGCEFGKEGAGNTAADKGGAILVAQGGVVEMRADEGAPGSVSYNTAAGEYGGGAIYVDASALLNTMGYIFEGNQAVSGGAFYLAAGANATSENNCFRKNEATSKNGGAVYCAGKLTDTGSSYYENKAARNGGAIIVMEGGEAALTAKEGASQNLFSGNAAVKVNGGAVFVNGGNLKIDGFTFEGNTGKTYTDSAIHVEKGSAAVENAVFQGAAKQSMYVKTALSFQNLTDARIFMQKNTAAIVLTGDAGSNVQLKPAEYVQGAQLLTGEGVDFSQVTLIQKNEGGRWYLDSNGVLQVDIVASITRAGETVYYETLTEAVQAANAAEGETEIVVMMNVSIDQTIEIQKKVTFVNAPAAIVTLSRGSATGELFTVAECGNLILGTNDVAETGKLVIDGAWEKAIAARTVTVNTGASFTLGKNATLQNANSTVVGAAIHTSGTETYIYGTVQNNATTVDCAGLYVSENAGAVIDGAVFRENRCTTSGAGAAMLIRPGAQVNCQNAIYENNTVPASKNGGAIYIAGAYTDTNSTYIGNQAKNGGAIFLGAATANVRLTGTDSQKAVFQNNQARGASSSKGGALYNNGGTLTVEGYTFTGNTSQQNIASPTEKKNAQIWGASGTTTLKNNIVN